MPTTTFEIRICESCGLRYPLVRGHPFGTRCPTCMGITRSILSRQMVTESEPGSHPRRTGSVRFDRTGSKEKEGGMNWSVLLDNIRSAWNVGSILRSADGFGFAHAYLCGITPTADHEAVRKTSLGAEDSMTWSYHKDAVRLVKGLKAQGWSTFALEADARATELHHGARVGYDVQQKILILGNEVTGVDPELLELCDALFEIPMRGAKRSFNVAIAFGIAAYALTDSLTENHK